MAKLIALALLVLIAPMAMSQCLGTFCTSCLASPAFCQVYDDATCIAQNSNNANFKSNTDANLCISCPDSNPANFAPPLTPPCQRCNFLNFCSVCNTGFTMEPLTGTCTQCMVANCVLCNTTNPNQCIFCALDTLTPNVAGSECVQCQWVAIGCTRCETSNVCSECANVGAVQYLPNTAGNNCILCNITSCATCNSKQVCATCASGFLPSTNSLSCVVCSILHCDFCNFANICASCSAGFLPNLASTMCNDCSAIPNCKICNSGSQCLACKVNPVTFAVQLTNAALNACFDCSIIGCQFCSANNVCQHCISPLQKLNLASTACVTCSPTYCATCNIPNTCSSYQSCPVAGQLTNIAGTACFSCAILNCQFCSTHNSCQKCVPGYVPTDTDSNGLFESCAASTNTCPAGRKPSPFLGVCLPCNVPNCDSCWPNGRCSECAGALLPNPFRTACTVCGVANCLKCSTPTYCNRCHFGFDPSGGSCIRKI